LRQRIKLFRAASLLKAALLAFREVTFNPELAKVEFDHGILYLYRSPEAEPTPYAPFLDHLVKDPDLKEAVLLHDQCTLSMSLLCRLTDKLLSGKIFPKPCCFGSYRD
jgi:hypothetical protein